MFVGSLHKHTILGFPALPSHNNKDGENDTKQSQTGGNERVSIAVAIKHSSQAGSGGGSEGGNAEDSETRAIERWTEGADSEGGLHVVSATHSSEGSEGRAAAGAGEGGSEIGSEQGSARGTSMYVHVIFVHVCMHVSVNACLYVHLTSSRPLI